jgi:septum site-determining protein MinD
MRTRTISVHSYRGGTGKSNFVANLAAVAAGRGMRVGVVDTDIPSPGIHMPLGLDIATVKATLNDFLWERCAITDAVYDVTPEGLPGRVHLVPSSLRAADIARIIKDGFDVGRLNDGFQQLGRALGLDVLLLDTHPGVNEETLLSIAISDALVLLVRPDQQDFQGTAVTVALARQLDVSRIHVVLNKVPAGLEPAALIERAQRAFEIPVLGLLPLSDAMLLLGSAALVSRRSPEDPYAQALHALAPALLD